MIQFERDLVHHSIGYQYTTSVRDDLNNARNASKNPRQAMSQLAEFTDGMKEKDK